MKQQRCADEIRTSCASAGEAVVERDRALTAMKEMVECFDSQGPWPHDAEEGCVRMERPRADTRAVLSLPHAPDRHPAPEVK